jgi:DNA repair protein RecO (recombination protein O)
MSKILESTGIILRRHSLGETDRIITFFTRQFGKIRAVAKGAQRTKSRWSGILEPLQQVNTGIFHRGEKALSRLNYAEVIERFDRIIKDLASLEASYGILELLDRFTPMEETNIELYDLSIDVLRKLNKQDIPPRILIRYFQLRFITLSGYALELNQCTRCNKARGSRTAHLNSEEGGIICRSCMEDDTRSIVVSGGSIQIMQEFLKGSIPDSDREIPFKRFLNETDVIIQRIFEFHFDSALRSEGLLMARNHKPKDPDS